ncbi:MAG: protein translocase subunit SecF [Myxococcales bacterium]|nr:protein translocase subunit SecF [Myxococcales bacterium]
MEFFKPGKQYNFLGVAGTLTKVSALLVIASWALVATKGLNFGIDFAGGTEALLAFSKPVDIGDLKGEVEKVGLDTPEVVIYGLQDEGRYFVRSRTQSLLSEAEGARIKTALAGKFGDPILWDASDESGEEIRVQFKEPHKISEIEAALTEAGVAGTSATKQTEASNPTYLVRLPGVRQRLQDALVAKYGKVTKDDAGAFVGEGAFFTIERMESVGSAVGRQMRNQGILAVLYALIGILLYVSFRFDLRYSPGAVVALVHDVSITIGIFSLAGLEFNLPIIAALLAIVGYSLNDTIVVYDRIRESLKMGLGSSLPETINLSVSDTISRTVLTSLTTFLAVLSIFVFGGGIIQNFAFAMLVGIIVGTYSSIYIASPIVIAMDRYLKGRQASAA